MSTAPGLVRSSHVSGLNSVAGALAEMRAAMLRPGDDSRAVRFSVLTLVVACADRDAARQAGEVVEQMATNHPTRAIVLVADPTGARRIEADLSLFCSAAGGEQVCVEMVRLEVGGEPARHLRSVVGPLLLPDVPVHLWLAGAPPLEQALDPDALQLCERVILDSDAYPDPAATLAAVGSVVGADRPPAAVGDLAWSRIRGWREMLGRAFDGSELRGFAQGIRMVELRHAGQRSAQALLFEGWLRSRLDRPGMRAPAITRVPGDGAGGELLGVAVLASNRDRQARIEISGEGGSRTTTISVEGPMRTSTSTWTVRVEPQSLVALVGAELEEQGPDPLYTAALQAVMEEPR